MERPQEERMDWFALSKSALHSFLNNMLLFYYRIDKSIGVCLGVGVHTSCQNAQQNRNTLHKTSVCYNAVFMLFQTDSDKFTALGSILNRCLAKDIQKLSLLHQTSTWETFDSLMIRLCPKYSAIFLSGNILQVIIT